MDVVVSIMQVLIFCDLGLKTPIHAPEIRVFGDKIRERVVQFGPLKDSLLLLGVVTSVPLLAEIDQEMRP